ncbi:hypothetical protein LZ30DRAFT_276090 [Colletotrichum cereale]|nr:hypothetical protein LZ30DRAFT_276090 [Colletotrichum cereale]
MVLSMVLSMVLFMFLLMFLFLFMFMFIVHSRNLYDTVRSVSLPTRRSQLTPYKSNRREDAHRVCDVGPSKPKRRIRKPCRREDRLAFPSPLSYLPGNVHFPRQWWWWCRRSARPGVSSVQTRTTGRGEPSCGTTSQVPRNREMLDEPPTGSLVAVVAAAECPWPLTYLCELALQTTRCLASSPFLPPMRPPK